MISGRANSWRSASGDTRPYRSTGVRRPYQPDERTRHHSNRTACHLQQRRHPQSDGPHQASGNGVGAGCRGYTTDDTGGHHPVGHRGRTGQRVGATTREADDLHLVDPEGVGDGAQVLGECEHGVVLVRRRRTDSRTINTDQPDLPFLGVDAASVGICLRAPGVPCSQKTARPCGSPTRRIQSGGRHRRRCCLPAWDGRLRQACPECRMPAVTVCSPIGHHGVMADDELDELYCVKPEEFTALRTKLVAAAKKRGDASAAKKRVSAARRPTTAAWVVNQLAHRDEDVKQSLTDLGERLGAAHAAMDGDTIRQLSSEQRSLVDELARAAFEGADLTNPSAALREDVTGTLQAAVADPDVTARLGRLTKAERWSGFGDFGDTTTVSAAARSSKAKAEPKQTRRKPDRKRTARRRPRVRTRAGGGEDGVGRGRAGQGRRRQRVVRATNRSGGGSAAS